VALQELQLNELRSTLERKTADIASVNRALKGITDSFSNGTQEVVELRRYVIERLDVSRDKLAKLRDEFETRMHTVESEHFRLRDNQMGLDTTIASMKSEVDHVRSDVEEAKQGVVDLWRAKVNVNLVEEQQQEFSEFARRVDAHVAGLGQQFGNLVDDVKAHFQTAADVVGHTTAQQIQEMREKYKEEVKRADVVLENLDSFPRRQRELEESMRTGVDKVERESRTERERIHEVLTHQLKKAENERGEMSVELRQLKKTVRDMCESGGTGGSGLGGGGGAIGTDVLSMLVESSLLAATLESQDDRDRKSIALFGYKPGAEQDGGGAVGSSRLSAAVGNRESTTTKLPSLDGSRSSRGGGGGKAYPTPRRRLLAGDPDATGGGAAPADPVVTLDRRCLACSGSQATVLAGFKLACLQYAPSPVQYQNVTYSRSELIRLRIDLLNQVKEQLQSVE